MSGNNNNRDTSSSSEQGDAAAPSSTSSSSSESDAALNLWVHSVMYGHMLSGDERVLEDMNCARVRELVHERYTEKQLRELGRYFSATLEQFDFLDEHHNRMAQERSELTRSNYVPIIRRALIKCLGNQITELRRDIQRDNRNNETLQRLGFVNQEYRTMMSAAKREHEAAQERMKQRHETELDQAKQKIVEELLRFPRLPLLKNTRGITNTATMCTQDQEGGKRAAAPKREHEPDEAGNDADPEKSTKKQCTD